MSISDEFKVGVLATFGLAVLILGYTFIKGNNLFKENQEYYAVYNNVQGLLESSQVLVNGYPVGKVTKFSLYTDTGSQAKIITTFTINEGINIPKNSKARITSTDLMGTRAIEIILGDTSVNIVPGDTLAGTMQEDLQEKVEQMMVPVKNKAEELFASFNDVAISIEGILKGGTIDSTIKRAARGMEMLELTAFHIDSIILAQAGNIDTILTNINQITTTFSASNEDMGRILTNVADITDSLSNTSFVEMVENLNTSLHQLTDLLETANSGEGTIGLLLEDPELYNNLLEITSDMDSLMVDLKENPNRYVHFSLFGKDPDKKKKKKGNN